MNRRPLDARHLSWFFLATLIAAACSSKQSEIAVEQPQDGGCSASCSNRQCGPDGCGGTCGTCGGDERCNEQTWKCDRICSPETDAELCARLDKECGSVTLTDNCGDPRRVDCGACELPKTCDATTNLCRCVAESDGDFCAARHIQCGGAGGDDHCGTPRSVAECGPCAERYDCTAGACVPCVAGGDADLCLAAAATCGTLVARDGCGDERTVQCGSCALPEFCSPTTLQCGAAPVPANDECNGAERLVFVAGQALVEGQVTGATDSGSSPNCPSPGADVVYVFTTTAMQNVDISLVPLLPMESVLSLRSDCANAFSDFACQAATARPGVPNTMALRRLPAGTYYLWVDSNQTAFGSPFTLEVALGDLPPPPTNDTCATAAVVNPAASGTVQIPGTTLDAADNYGSSCGTLDGTDVVYRLDFATDVSAVIQLTRSSEDPGYVPALYLRSDCASALAEDQLACAAPTVGGGAPLLRLPILLAGSYYLIVDGSSGSAGGFTVEVRTGPPMRNDACPAAEPLVFTNDVAVVSGDLTAATDDSFGTCSFGGRDLVYSFEMDRLGTAQLELTTPSGSPLRPAVYLRSACDSGEVPNGCASAAAGQTATLAVPRLTEGTWYVWVDGNGSGAGEFTLTVRRNDPPQPPSNDTCARAEAIPLDPSTGQATVTATTMWATDDLTGKCAAMTGRDLAYAVTTTSDAMLTARVVRDPADTLFNPAVVIRSFCPVDSSEIACGTAANGTAAAATPLLPAGTYYILVDGTLSSFGSFTLEVTASPPPANDDCTAPTLLSFDSTGMATVTGDTTQAKNDYSAICAASPGQDFVYVFTLRQPSKVEATVAAGPDSVARHLVAIRDHCGVAGSERACEKAITDGGAATAVANRLEAGTYFVLVDGTTATSNGPFTLTVTASAPPTGAPANDACSAATPLAFNGSGVASIQGSTADASDDMTGTCATAQWLLNGNDVVYTVTLTETAQLSAKIMKSAGASSFNPAVYIRTACGTSLADEVACARNTNGTAIATFPAGTYYVVVDGQNGTSGSFTLEVTKGTAIAGDGCANPLPLTFDSQGVATASGNNANANPNADGPCCSMIGAKDLVYAFTLATPKSVTAVVGAASGSSYRPSIFMRSACADPATQLTCAAAGAANTPVTVSSGRLAAGTHYLWVDSAATSYTGAFTVTLTASDPQPAPANDLCSAAQALTFDARSGWVRVSGDTTWATDDSQGSCGEHDGPDLAYRFTLAGNSMVSATVSPDSTTAGYLPALYLRTDCGVAVSELGCANPVGAGLARLSFDSLPAGTYYLLVDGARGGGAGKFNLDVYVRALQTNDECAGAEELVFDGTGFAVVSGDNALATAGSAGTCASSGPDVVYKFTTSADKTLDLVMTPGSTLQPALYVRSTCDDVTSELPAACLLGTMGTPLSLRVPRLPAGTWYIWADSSSNGSGPFRLEARLSEPPGSPLNDACVRAEVLSFTANSAHTSGDTTYASSDLPGTCEIATGADLVYSFTLAAPQKVTATLTRNTSATAYKPTVSIRSDCMGTADSAELACGRQSTATATAIANSLQAGVTYFVVVDGAAGTFGAFDLNVTLATPVAGPANDACAGAEALTFSGNVATVSGTTVDAQDDAKSNNCGPLVGPDVVYTFTTTADQKVTAEVTPGGWAPMVYIRGTCGGSSATNQLGCGYTMGNGSKATAVAKALPAGTYYVWVDGTATTAKGAFTLTVTLTSPENPPANNTCANAVALVRGQAVQGDTTLSVNANGTALSSTCGQALSNFSLSSPDLVYSYTPSATETFWVTLTPGPSFNAVLWMMKGTCRADGQTCLAASNRGNTGGAETLTVAGVAGTTYYFVVDGPSGSIGPFSILVQ